MTRKVLLVIEGVTKEPFVQEKDVNWAEGTSPPRGLSFPRIVPVDFSSTSSLPYYGSTWTFELHDVTQDYYIYKLT